MAYQSTGTLDPDPPPPYSDARSTHSRLTMNSVGIQVAPAVTSIFDPAVPFTVEEYAAAHSLSATVAQKVLDAAVAAGYVQVV